MAGVYGEFSDAEVGRIMHFLGYPFWRALAASVQLGYPAATQPMFLVLDSMKRMDPAGVVNIRKDLCQLEAIEAQMGQARGRMAVAAVGEVKMRENETAMLRDELIFWQRRLADDFGVVFNPYSQMDYLGMPGSMNAKVTG